MPNTIDIYSPRTMGAVVRNMPETMTFLRDRYFTNHQHYMTERVDFDIVKGGRPMAPFVTYRGGAELIDKQGYETMTFTTPLLAPATLTTAEELLQRMPGESVYSAMSPEQRAVRKLADELTMLRDTIDRREEWMCAMLLTTGKIPVIGNQINAEIDVGFTQKSITAKSWGADGADILGDMAKAQSEVYQNGYVHATDFLLGTEAAEYFVNNAKIQKLLDIKDYSIGRVAPQGLPKGVRYIGHISAANVDADVFTYNEHYEDPTTKELKPLIPKNKMICLPSDMNAELAYGQHTYMDQRTQKWYTDNSGRTPDQWVEKNPDRKMVAMYSRPMPVPKEVNAWYVMDVLAQ